MKKIFFAVLLVIPFFSCGIREPSFIKECSFSNKNAAVYVLNYTGQDILLEFYKTDGLKDAKTVTASTVKDEEREKLRKYADVSEDDFTFLTYSYIEYGDYQLKTEGYALPVNLSDKDLTYHDFLNTHVESFSIKSMNGKILYESEIDTSESPSAVEFRISGLSQPRPYDFKKKLHNGDLMFKSRPSDFLFVDCDVDFSEKTEGYYGTVKNPRYVIVMGVQELFE